MTTTTPLLLCVLLCVVCVSICGGVQRPPRSTSHVDRIALKNKVQEMFFHAYDSYMDYAFPADELMPLSCKGRVRGVDADRGDIDEALGRFSLTLVDTLDTLALINVTEFVYAVQRVKESVTFDTNLVVSTFEVNIRMLGGLLGAHSVMIDLASRLHSGRLSLCPQASALVHAYHDDMLTLAIDLGNRLLVAFDTPTGLPYSRVNLKNGVDENVRRSDVTCTACAGSMLLEFAALSRYSGDDRYEEAARKAMEALWSRRGVGSDLVGTTINITSGNWMRTDTGVGAGIDSYYEYLLKSYVFLGDQTYLDIFNTHYAAINRYLRRGPFLIDSHMHSPLVMARRFMDSLQTFWPGLQVLKGDLEAAIETHDMYTHIIDEHGFIPESFTSDFKVNWAAAPIRPEFVESTYFLYQATGDPHYLEVGRSIIEAIEAHTRVRCGYAALLDVRSGVHEDKLDSFVLAETFKYLYLLFAEESELPIDLNDYVFTTEAHLLPLRLSRVQLNLNPFNEPLPNPASDAPAHDNSCAPFGNDKEIFLRLVRGTNRFCPRYDIDRVDPALQFRPQTTARRTGVTVPTHVHPEELNVHDEGHQAYLNSIGIFIDIQASGIRLLQVADRNFPRYNEGVKFLAELVEAQTAAERRRRGAIKVFVVAPVGSTHLSVDGGPAMFGPSLDEYDSRYTGSLVLASPMTSCVPVPPLTYSNKIVVARRGGCMFVDKTRHAQAGGAMAVIIIDNVVQTMDNPPLFSMSGDGTNDVRIPAVFLHQRHGESLLNGLINIPHAITLQGARWN